LLLFYCTKKRNKQHSEGKWYFVASVVSIFQTCSPFCASKNANLLLSFVGTNLNAKFCTNCGAPAPTGVSAGTGGAIEKCPGCGDRSTLQFAYSSELT
jgi:hypothetical protein